MNKKYQPVQCFLKSNFCIDLIYKNGLEQYFNFAHQLFLGSGGTVPN